MQSQYEGEDDDDDNVNVNVNEENNVCKLEVNMLNFRLNFEVGHIQFQ